MLPPGRLPAVSPLGYLNVTFADGSLQRIPVSLADDSGNWWNPFPRKNAAVAWKHENPAAPVGLYAAPFALEARRSAPA